MVQVRHPDSQTPNPLFRSPEFSGGLHGDDFEINQVIPMYRPVLQQIGVRRFHDLKATRPTGFNPTCVVDDAIREHPPAMFEAFSDQHRAARLEVFNDHEEHAPQSIPDWERIKPAIANRKFQIQDSKCIVENREAQMTHHQSQLSNLEATIDNDQTEIANSLAPDA